mmetsp:Transcript_27854/g.64714  ORF Transcript_27854/g.64714 Transcript_27854/m.64714 type:complete len:370 (-) Transcript_27854:124-1233(-)|eukprot:CAMPEP_0178403068 /NCGR_PEP_ID=MMETSP0689_2-20121128/17176_1 /TAXON_ID=160604 /ORGANISM="Amphidinium massartii, Strain CS-259" /LENGTH=369 /DNA_ID=CAMNT_0020024007 /DNA_START=26 /DNA_END=1135 /DNA_ORIENTATION=+
MQQPSSIAASLGRVTLVLLGPPGDGKSTLGNLLACGHSSGPLRDAGSLPFTAGDSFDPVSAEVAHADFEYQGVNHRVIDTTGLVEGLPATADRLASVLKLAAGGIDAFLFVIRKGRFTDGIFEQLLTFEDAAGTGALKRTVIVFSHCGRESNEQLMVRCRKSTNERLRETLQKTAGLVGVDSLASHRNKEDRANVLSTTAGVCRVHRDVPKQVPTDPQQLRQDLQELDFAVGGLSGERRENLEAKLGNLRSGCTSLEAVRRALQEARERQRAEDRHAEETQSLQKSLEDAQGETTLYREVADKCRPAPQPSGPFGCCNPVGRGWCENPCEPCDTQAKAVLQQWHEDRRKDIEARFADNDVIAEQRAAAH